MLTFVGAAASCDIPDQEHSWRSLPPLLPADIVIAVAGYTAAVAFCSVLGGLHNNSNDAANLDSYCVGLDLTIRYSSSFCSAHV